jgi:hypothetical protein
MTLDPPPGQNRHPSPPPWLDRENLRTATPCSAAECFRRGKALSDSGAEARSSHPSHFDAAAWGVMAVSVLPAGAPTFRTRVRIGMIIGMGYVELHDGSAQCGSDSKNMGDHHFRGWLE